MILIMVDNVITHLSECIEHTPRASPDVKYGQLIQYISIDSLTITNDTSVQKVENKEGGGQYKGITRTDLKSKT